MAAERISRPWLVVAMLVLLAAAFAWLGRWQLERAALHRSIETRFAAGDAVTPLEPPLPPQLADEYRYRKLRLEGHYEARVQILLDNMTQGGAAGYEVLTPFRAESGALVLVNRGWVPAAPDRSVLPDVELGGGAAVVTGRVDRLPRAAIALGSAPPPQAGPVMRLSFPDYADIERVLGQPVERFELLLDPEAPDGFSREWAPDTVSADRNIAYAVQWFGLGALAIILAIGAGLRGRRPVPVP
jgi:surfeit locus 1 family protein